MEPIVVIGAGPADMALPAGYTVKAAADAYDKAQDFRSATPVGGEKKFNQYVKNHLQFPEQEDALTQAVVVLSFMVGYDGRPAKITVLKSPGKAFSDEAVRLLMNGPDWQPAGTEAVQMEQATRIQILFRK